MLEELEEYLIRRGWDAADAEDADAAYYNRDIEGVEDLADELGDDSLVQAVRDWQKEVGED